MSKLNDMKKSRNKAHAQQRKVNDLIDALKGLKREAEEEYQSRTKEYDRHIEESFTLAGEIAENIGDLNHSIEVFEDAFSFANEDMGPE